MIVPATRLLIWFAVIALPFATLAGVVPETMPLAVGMVILFVFVVLGDAGLSLRVLRGISIDLTPVTRATQERPFAITVRIRNVDKKARTLRIALASPPELAPAVDEVVVEVPADMEWLAFDWTAIAVRRGKFQIVAGRIKAPSALAFWELWKTVPVASEVRVYPNLARERSHVAALFLNRGGYGIHAQRQVGRGRDFEKLREYNSGDGIQDVHWKATAKRGHPVTKVFQIERTQEIYVILDASRLSARRVERGTLKDQRTEGAAVPTPNPQPSTALERFIAAALVLGLAAEKQGDLFGLITFSDKIETFIRARHGKAHYHDCRDALYTLESREVTPDFEELSTFIRLRLRRRALLLFLTSLDDPVTAEAFVRSMDLLCRQHLVLVNMLQPAGVRPLFSNENVTTIPELYGELAGHLRWQALRELEKVLQRRGVRLSLLQSEKLAADLVSQYLGVKQRQAL